MRNPVSRFAYVRSDLGMKRSKFDRKHDHLTTMSAGKLYPILVDEVLPGDTYTVDTASLVRMSTPIHPVMGNCFMDQYFFFVPNRIIWTHWREFMGESPDDPYINPIEYSIPQLKPQLYPQGDDPMAYGAIPPKSLLDYLGVPSNTVPQSINALPVRAFCAIWNQWFRDQNLQNAINFTTEDSDVNYGVIGDGFNNNASGDYYVTNTGRGGDLPPVNKYHDYFTSALIAPQKGEAVPIPLSGFAPVYATSLVDADSLTNKISETQVDIRKANGQSAGTSIIGTINGKMAAFAGSGLISQNTNLEFNNLGADLSNIAGVYSTINDLRYAFQLQKYLENDNRSGTRYRELLKGHFGVTSPDGTQQVPEFLGGKRIPINISQVLQTSSTDTTSPQGNTAAYSLTTDNYSAFTKSFTEHGWLIGVACIRTEHTYAQGTERFWHRAHKFDYYFPEFANISDQPIYNKELYTPTVRDFETDINGVWNTANEIFGFQEPWADYRYKPNRISGEFRPTYQQSLDVWHYGDSYTSQPFLSSEWIAETRSNIDRTLAVSSDVSDQFICDFYFNMSTTRVMPVYSIPGLADHH